MLALTPVFGDSVTCAKCGKATFCYGRICRRDVKMGSPGSLEFTRHFGAKGHWQQVVVYRVDMGLPIYTNLMEPIVLSASHEEDFRSWLFVDMGELTPFREDLLPKHAKVESKVLFMTLVFCL